MADKPSRSDLERQLEATTDHIKRRLDALGGEVGSLRYTVRDALRDNPLVAVGGAVAAGLVVGLILGGRGKDPFRADNYRRALVEEYVDAVAREARQAVAGGKEPGVAVREALRDRVPLVVLEDTGGGTVGALRQIFDLLLKTSVGFLMSTVLDRVNETLELDRRIADSIPAARAQAQARTAE